MQVQSRRANKEMGQAYRDFSRSRYVEIKVLFPRMPEAEKVRMVIHEWEHMPLDEQAR